jgi:RNA polymerase sigma factor (sigma-70 family)
MKKNNSQLHGSGNGRVTNETLMALSAAGDEIAFRKLVDKNNGWLVEMITFHLNGDEARAKDIVLEFWITAWKDLRNGLYHEQGDSVGWMKTHAYWKMLDDIKKEERHPHETLPGGDLEEWYGEEDHGIQEYERSQMLGVAEQYMHGLVRRIVNMHVLEEKTNAEIAKELHLAKKKVKKTYAAGIAELQEEMVKLEKSDVH